MKLTTCILSIAIAALLAFSGTACHKKDAAGDRPQTLEEGMARLRTALSTASPEVQSNLYHGVNHSIRYADYSGASVALQQIASDPSLTTQQKNVVDDVDALLKQAIEKQQNTPQPAQ
ncbi:MAG: hypothetical protein ABSE48_19670 [Verrucomicrobiota bacterium]